MQEIRTEKYTVLYLPEYIFVVRHSDHAIAVCEKRTAVYLIAEIETSDAMPGAVDAITETQPLEFHYV